MLAGMEESEENLGCWRSIGSVAKDVVDFEVLFREALARDAGIPAKEVGASESRVNQGQYCYEAARSTRS
jgi:hypothetical protein